MGDKKGLKRRESKGVILCDAELKSKFKMSNSLPIFPERFVVVNLALMNSICFFPCFLFERIGLSLLAAQSAIRYASTWRK